MSAVFPVKKEDVARIWPRAAKYLQQAIDAGLPTHNIDDVLEGIMADKMVLWLLMNNARKLCGAAITQIEEYPRMRLTVLRWLGGNDIDEWQNTGLRALASWARLNGCDLIRIDGRNGWARKVNAETVGSVCLLHVNELLSRTE